VVTPRKGDIISRARAIAMQRQIREGLPAITPTEFELKESGFFREAQIDLMGSGMEDVIGKTEAESGQLEYLDVMAQEMNLRVIPQKALRNLQKATGFEWTNGWTEHKKPKRRVPIPVKTKEKERKKLEKYVRDQQKRRKLEMIRQAKKDALAKKRRLKVTIPKPKAKPKKRRRLHVGRNGKKPRILKGFVFGDDVWKVRSPRRRKR